MWARRLQDPDAASATIIAEESAESLVGFVHVAFEDDPRWGALIDNIHVAGERHRWGVGTRLMAAAAEAVIERRASGGLYLWVLEQNVAAQAFYEARGGRFTERAPVDAPAGVPGRLNGSPFKLRYVWAEPAVLQRYG